MKLTAIRRHIDRIVSGEDDGTSMDWFLDHDLELVQRLLAVAEAAVAMKGRGRHVKGCQGFGRGLQCKCGASAFNTALDRVEADFSPAKRGTR